MLTTDWADVVEDLESLCELWKLIAAGEEDILVTELPEIPSERPPDDVLPRVLAVQKELERVRADLGSALGETQIALVELRTAQQVAGHYLMN